MRISGNNYLIGINSIFIISTLFVLMASSQVFAAMTYIADDRYVNITSCVNCDQENRVIVDDNFYPDSAYADWFITDSSYNQLSSMNANGFTASGFGRYTSDFDYWSGTSYFDIRFNLSVATEINLTGNLTTRNGELWGTGSSAFFLYDGAGNVLYSETLAVSDVINPFLPDPTLALMFNDTLSAGDYRVLAQGVPTGGGFATAFYSVDLITVPLPAAGPLFLFGLSALIFIRKRKILS